MYLYTFLTIPSLLNTEKSICAIAHRYKRRLGVLIKKKGVGINNTTQRLIGSYIKLVEDTIFFISDENVDINDCFNCYPIVCMQHFEGSGKGY